MQLVQRLVPQQTLQLRQILSPKMIQMLKTFQLPYADLVSAVIEENKDNVFLDIIRYDQLLDYSSHRKLTANQGLIDGDSADFIGRIQSKEKNLYEFLVSQLNLLNLSKKDHDIALLLIQGIDSQGYLPEYDTLKESIKTQYDVSDRKVSDILKIIQTFEPEGVGARNLKECLLIQVEEYDFEYEALREILSKIITYHLDDLSNQKFKRIAKALHIEEAGVQQLSDFIRSNLTPKPGLRFTNQEFNSVIIPSFEVRVENGQLVFANLERQQGISVQISEEYQAVLKDPATDEATKKYLEEKFERANVLVENLQRRYENLERIAKFILEKQMAFLQKGVHYLEPLLQKEIAQNFDLTPSTISRIVSSKFIQTPFGIFALKTLCPRQHFGKTAERLKQILQDIFDENPDLSDAKISQLLHTDYNIPIARRTVAKYRVMLGIPARG